MPERRLIAIALIAAGAVAATAGPVAGASAATRFAAPFNGLSTPGTAPCTNSAKPCLLAVAIGEAVAGDDVQLADGDYFKATKDTSPGAPRPPFDDPINVPTDVVLHGANPADLPVIHIKPDASGESGVYVREDGAVRDLAIKGTAAANLSVAATLILDANAVAERVRVETTAVPVTTQRACIVVDGAVLRDSVCLGRGSATNGTVTAIIGSSSTGIIAIRNVTAITTAAGSPGVDLLSSDEPTTANISNTIIRGTSADLSVRSPIPGGQVTANVDHTNWATQTSVEATGTSAKVVALAGNQNGATAATPKFVDAAAGDFRQLPGSPTIDAGVFAAANGPLALGGNARVLGVATDIGAFEFDPASVPPTTPGPTTPEPTTPQSTTPDPTTPPAAAGAGPSAGAGATLSTGLPDAIAPQLSGLKVSRTVKRSKGATIQFSLSEAASVVLTFGQPKAGRSVGGTCRSTTAKNRSQPRCTIPNVKGRLTALGRAGANTVSFKGKTASGKRLALGRYTLEATPTDAAGNRGLVIARTFALKR